MKDFDCIYIPGGGLLEDGSLPPWTKARLDLSLEYRKKTLAIACLSGGTVHKPPPIDDQGYPIFESRAAAAYLINQGCDPDRILTEIASYDTIGNAYYARFLFADPLSHQDILIITSRFHMARTQKAFRWIFSIQPEFKDSQLSFISSPNRGLKDEILTARVKREKKSLSQLQKTSQNIQTLRKLHGWIYRKHAAYAVSLQPETVQDPSLDSY